MGQCRCFRMRIKATSSRSWKPHRVTNWNCKHRALSESSLRLCMSIHPCHESAPEYRHLQVFLQRTEQGSLSCKQSRTHHLHENRVSGDFPQKEASWIQCFPTPCWSLRELSTSVNNVATYYCEENSLLTPKETFQLHSDFTKHLNVIN